MSRGFVFASLALAAIAAIALTGWAGSSQGLEREARSAGMHIHIIQLGDGKIRAHFEANRSVKQLPFGFLPSGHRERHWSVEDSAFRLTRQPDGDIIERIDGEKFNSVTVTASPDLIRLPKEYQPLARYGKDGLLLYTGHFWPMTKQGGRANAVFTITPEPGAKVVAFGERQDELVTWRSPKAHPAFVYLGALEATETDNVMALIDPMAPTWIVKEFAAVTPRAFDYLANAFGTGLKTKPNLFMAAPLGGDEGRISYSGDALPGQVQITLEGRGWLTESEKTQSIFRKSTVHEAVHLWQAAVRPGTSEASGWIHEGAADAIAAEAMLALGYWDAAQYEADFAAAREECARELDKGPLVKAEDRRDFRALYVCGHVIAVAVSIAQDASVGEFWREFMIAAERGDDGYNDADFYRQVEVAVGDADFASAVKFFAEKPLASPEREIAKLMDLAAAL